jgi:thiazole synthase
MDATKDILIIGGGIIGLAIAVELRQRGASVTVLSRDFQEAASHAAAGMLAPYAEQIPPSPMLELCRRSRKMYADWTGKLENLTGLETGYNSCGILSPVFELPDNFTPFSPTSSWLNQTEIHTFQPGLNPDILGGWWHPEDGQVDNRKLVHTLRQAAKTLGVNIQEGAAVQSIIQKSGRIDKILTKQREYQAQTYILATGSWSSQLIPLPVRPIKGQMLALRMPTPQTLERVLFGPNTYLVPRKNGRLIIGATSEDVAWTPQNTPQGIHILLERAMGLYPKIADWAIEDFWWGFRPGTTDELPILGPSAYDNLVLATGHYRNGILLAPITATLIADLITHQVADPLLKIFNCDRFFPKLDFSQKS